MIVYRIEHRESGYGPYQCYAMTTTKAQRVAERLCDEHQTCPAHPPFVRWGMRNGFRSRAKMHRWFKGFKKDLREANFVHCVYEVAYAYDDRAKRQVMFQPEHAKLLHRGEIR